MKASYFQRGESLDYIPTADTAAGTPVFLGKLAGITKLDIAANELGAIAVVGVFTIVKDSSVFTAGTGVYWDATNSKATATANANYLGVAIEAAATGDGTVKVLLNSGASDYVEPEESSSSSSSSSSSQG